jgi:hypothetical protein
MFVARTRYPSALYALTLLAEFATLIRLKALSPRERGALIP